MRYFHWLFRIVLWGVVASLCPISHGGDGILGDVEGPAEDFLMDYVVNGEVIAKNFACIGRGSNTGIQMKSSVIRDAEIWAIEARIGSRSKFSVMSRQGYEAGTATGRPHWEQTLEIDGERYYRRSTTGTARGLMLSEKADTPEDRTSTRRSLQTLDPYFLPFMESAAYLRSRNGLTEARRFLTNFELKSASREEGGVLGVWVLKRGDRGKEDTISCRVSILFAPKQGNMPARVTWDFPSLTTKKQHRAHDEVEFETVMSSQTKWERAPVGLADGKQEVLWVPRVIHRIDYFGQGSMTEIEFVFLWKKMEKQLLPAPTDFDWREPFAKSFNIDWREPYQEFVRRIAGSERPQ